MNIQGIVAFVTGANRGIGKAYVEALVQAGASRIYAAARSVETLKDVVAIAPDRIVPVALDVTNPDQIQAVAEKASDVTVLINNAGVLGAGGLFTDHSVETAQWEMTTNYFGTLYMIRAFAPVLQRNGGGSIVNLLSIASVVNVPVFSSYSASKAALYSLTQGIRAELAPQGTQVIGVFPGPVDTAMAEGVPLDKIAPIEVAKATLQAIEQGIEEVYPDPVSQTVFTDLQAPLKAVEKQFAGMLPQ
ncbi:MAG: SDR family oxidoreductase [Oculatellaceae cyanobacterium Prado106]|jgi:NAD(P)-dependent dehydrogenase (short-subunit alcohol dehydrogenase family)|nr:SDR family oxidoreductase [Oculatellaceae cyanobacterium Prado106]